MNQSDLLTANISKDPYQLKGNNQMPQLSNQNLQGKKILNDQSNLENKNQEVQNNDNTVKLIKKETNTVGGTVGATKEIVGYEIETDNKKFIKKESI